MKIIKVDRCSRCPHRFVDTAVADMTVDICDINKRNLDYRACHKKGEFPKGCPLPDFKEKK